MFIFFFSLTVDLQGFSLVKMFSNLGSEKRVNGLSLCFEYEFFAIVIVFLTGG